jgi:hypothetical protein
VKSPLLSDSVQRGAFKIPRFKQTLQKNFGGRHAPFHRNNVMSGDDKLLQKVVMSGCANGVNAKNVTQKNRRKFKPGTRDLMEVKKLQRSTELLVSKTNFEGMMLQ